MDDLKDLTDDPAMTEEEYPVPELDGYGYEPSLQEDGVSQGYADEEPYDLYDEESLAVEAWDDAHVDEPLTDDEQPSARASEAGRAAAVLLSRAAHTTATAVGSAAREIAAGATAVRDVRAAARHHSTARAELRSLRSELISLQDELDHRRQIEEDYETIVAEESAELESAQEAVDSANSRIATLTGERNQIGSELKALREANEERLRPYKNLMETTKGRSDDASVALADARRALRTAESQANDATRRRDQRMAAANRAVDNAAERLRRVQSDLDKLQSDPNASPTALPKLRDELASERAHLDTARSDVDRVSAECNQVVENAQAHLWAMKETLDAARTAAEAAKQAATEAREEYDALYKEARAQEGSLEEAMRDRANLISDTEAEREAAQQRIAAAEAVLAEANDIHDTPQVTADLAARTEAKRQEIEERSEELQAIAQSEQHLRASTRWKRVAFFAALGLAVAALVAILWFALIRPRLAARPGTDSSTQPVATAPANGSGGNTSTTTTNGTGGTSTSGTSSSSTEGEAVIVTGTPVENKG